MEEDDLECRSRSLQLVPTLVVAACAWRNGWYHKLVDEWRDNCVREGTEAASFDSVDLLGWSDFHWADHFLDLLVYDFALLEVALFYSEVMAIFLLFTCKVGS